MIIDLLPDDIDYVDLDQYDLYEYEENGGYYDDAE